MAKNLKLKIKNTQLAEALKQNKLKTTKAAPKETTEPRPAVEPPVEAAKLKTEVPASVEAAPKKEAAPIASPIEKEPTHVKPVSRPVQQKADIAPKPSFPPKKEEKAQGADAAVTPEKKPREDVELKGPKTADNFREFKDTKAVKKVPEKKTFDSRARQGLINPDEEGWRKRRIKSKRVLTQEEQQANRPKNLSVRLPISVKDLAAELKLKASQLLAKLFLQGAILTLNDLLDDETTVQLLGHEFGCEIHIDTSEEQRLRVTEHSIKEEISKADPSLLKSRPPVVAFMGHVDHGKTSLIDRIRKSNIAAGEAGAITQHIGAFRCHTVAGDLTILDTPGHEAFSAMRERGADVTDIVVLVIAGDEGMKAQTEEALRQAKEAGVPIVVALNKCDKPDFNPENVYRQLADHELLPESWGGATITVNCSAVSGQGIKELLEMLALQAEVLELKADFSGRARGTILESEMHKGLGAVATVLVQNGTLKQGDSIVFDDEWGRVKTMHDELGKSVVEATPSVPVKITGLSGLPEAGTEFIVVKDEKEAKELAKARLGQTRLKALHAKKLNLDTLMKESADNKKKKILNLILKADVQGSLEALKSSLMKIKSDKAEISIVSAQVGEISESDIELAHASGATVIGFHSKIESRAEDLIKTLKVTVKCHDIIYHIVDDVKEIMTELLDKIPVENDTGQALVKAVFKSSQVGNIAGCQVLDGTIARNNHVRLIRDNQVIWKGSIGSLKRVKEDVREISKGYECGILLNGFNDFKENDIIQAYEINYLKQKL